MAPTSFFPFYSSPTKSLQLLIISLFLTTTLVLSSSASSSSSSSSSIFHEKHSNDTTDQQEESSSSRLQKLIAIATIFTIVFFMVLCPRPIPQPLWYHNLADRRSCDVFDVGRRRTVVVVPNYNDIFSNIPFAVVSILGIYHLQLEKEDPKMIITINYSPPVLADPEQEKRLWLVYYIGVGLVSLGSSYYHWEPNNERLAWDRLPMTIAFVALTAIIIQETVCDVSLVAFTIMILVGIATVMYWRMFDDLRPYILIQGGAIASIPICLGFFGSIHYDDRSVIRHYMEAVLFYAIAKVTEVFDKEIFQWTDFRVSGHTLKHLISSIAAGWAMIILSSRSIQQQS